MTSRRGGCRSARRRSRAGRKSAARDGAEASCSILRAVGSDLGHSNGITLDTSGDRARGIPAAVIFNGPWTICRTRRALFCDEMLPSSGARSRYGLYIGAEPSGGGQAPGQDSRGRGHRNGTRRAPLLRSGLRMRGAAPDGPRGAEQGSAGDGHGRARRGQQRGASRTRGRGRQASSC